MVWICDVEMVFCWDTGVVGLRASMLYEIVYIFLCSRSLLGNYCLYGG